MELACVIVDLGKGSKVLQTAKKHGMTGGTVLLGIGTVQNRLLEFLGISDVRKEIVLMGADRKTVQHALEQLDNKFHFSKPHHGIAFTTSISQILGATSIQQQDAGEAYTRKENMERWERSIMYQSILTIVERGNGEYVIDAATEAGAKGGTIINARGSGIHETSKVFSMEIEPEKEIVLILSRTESTDAIAAAIRDKLKIDEPGNGIIFIQDVNRTYGLYE